MKVTQRDIENARNACYWSEKYMITSTVGTDFIPIAAEGCWILGLLAKSGTTPRMFLDFSSGYSLNALGYNNQRLRQKINEQLDTGLWGFPVNDYWHYQPAKLAKRLCEMAPIDGAKKVFFSNSGAEAVEAAIKMCEDRRLREKSDRFLFLSFLKAFHGRTKGALSLTASKPVHKEGFRTAQKVINMPFPAADDEPSIKKFDVFFETLNSKLVNAVIIELIQGEGGINVIDSGSLNKLLEICQKNNIFTIVDEVQTGFYRTGRLFASDFFGIKPDIICLAKAAGGSFPLGITIANTDFDFKEQGRHSSTNGGNLVACAAGNALLDELEKLDEYGLENKIEILRDFAPEGVGLMRRINLLTAEERNKVVNKALEQGLLLIGAGNTAIRLMPPLIISEEELIMGINILIISS